MVFVAGMLMFSMAMAQQAQPDKTNINSIQKTKPGVPFDHKKHTTDYKVKCDKCHHVYKDGKNVFKEGDPVQKCGACHTDKMEGKKLKLQNAYHKNCKDCHKEANKGPFQKCEDCHKQ
ncbi:MAG: cytochrome c3 family protein [Deltaproteobacteria bacterium]|nr:cytochrome c3 family protein [Deltaproteobacteria bacterium]MBF0508225.1 cytochrome c3 family protein [Deltaproteobacteria bacterium]MBF0526232.1 cytochrome c3 family protein [Deltaproteobacteria bacterium]